MKLKKSKMISIDNDENNYYNEKLNYWINNLSYNPGYKIETFNDRYLKVNNNISCPEINIWNENNYYENNLSFHVLSYKKFELEKEQNYTKDIEINNNIYFYHGTYSNNFGHFLHDNLPVIYYLKSLMYTGGIRE